MATAEAQVNVNTNLQKQDLSNLHVNNLTPLSPEVISRQATINIGTIGHVAHGKSTVVKAISGVQTVRFKNELERNITIKLERLSESKIQKLKNSKEFRKQYDQKQRLLLRRLAKSRQQHEPGMEGLEIPDQVTAATSQQLLSHLKRSRRSLSSGYVSNGCDEPDTTIAANNDAQKIPNPTVLLKRHRQSLGNQQLQSPGLKRSKNNAGQAIKKRKGEYVVECIESVEVVHVDQPIFFVKWLGYDSSQNTWESFENIADCAELEYFVERQRQVYESYIDIVVGELETELAISEPQLQLNSSVMREVDNFETLPLQLDMILLAQYRAAGSRNLREPQRIKARALRRLQLQRMQCARRKQLLSLAQFENSMNTIELPSPPIRVRNEVDLDTIDASFTYIQKNMLTDPVPRPEISLVGCHCRKQSNGVQCNGLSGCCARLAGELFAYDRNTRRLRLPQGSAIYECNSRCSCDDTCTNRVVQNGRKHSLELFKTDTKCGWGVRTPNALRKGEFVCEYVGEIISSDEANERGKIYDDKGRTYLFDLDYNMSAESEFSIDAANYGNISHFINHSCDPNLAVFPCWIEHLDLSLPRLVFFTLRPIKAGEELSFDYIRADNEAVPYENLSNGARIECRCGAKNCRKVLF